MTGCSSAGPIRSVSTREPSTNPNLIPAAAQRYGNQCVVLSADVKRVDGQFRVFAKGGREDTGLDALDWIAWAVDHGAGEVVPQQH